MSTAAQLPTIPAEIYVGQDYDMLTWGDAEREAFVQGWEHAGGYTDDYAGGYDARVDAPWAMPWIFMTRLIHAPACMSMEELGAWWWSQCRDEVADMLRIGADNSEWEEVEDWY